MKGVPIPAQFCPSCHATITGGGCAQPGGAALGPPRVGDFAICLSCVIPLVFTDGLVLVEMTKEHFARLTFCDQMTVYAAQSAALTFRRAFGTPGGARA